jgi:8-hydroxy-5-deazaflavin:NADPH oxidoreductase
VNEGRGVRSQAQGQPTESSVYCGDDESGKGLAPELIRDVGFDPMDAGPLRIARYTEPFALLVA